MSAKKIMDIFVCQLKEEDEVYFNLVTTQSKVIENNNLFRL